MSFFTIIIPSFNRGHLIPKAISSVLNQTFQDWELIIVDDGSTDHTKEVIKGYKDSRLRYVYQENSERSAARNNGIRNATSEWICFLDSDDYFLPNHLKVFHDFILKNKLKSAFLVSGGLDEKDGNLIEKPVYDSNSNQHPAKFILEKTSITPISVCIHKSCLQKHNFIDKYKKSYWEDTHLWIRLALDFPFYQLPEFTNVLAEHKARSVNSNVTRLRVNDHISMIKHLQNNYSSLLSDILTNSDFRMYKDRKYRMFLYQTRQNRQFWVSFSIWWDGIQNRPSFYLMSEFPKIFLNKIGIGLNG